MKSILRIAWLFAAFTDLNYIGAHGHPSIAVFVAFVCGVLYHATGEK